MAALTQSQAGATQAGQAPYQTETVNTEGAPTLMTREQAIERATGKPMPSPSAPTKVSPAPVTYAFQPPGGGAIERGTAPDAATAEDIGKGVISRPAGLRLQDQGAGAAQKEKGQLDAKRVQALEEKLPSLNLTSRRLDRLAQLTRDDKAYAAAGAELKTTLGSIAQSLGLNVAKEKTANSEEYIAHVAELLKERLSSKDYGSGTGISNLDLATAGRPLPEIAKTAQGRKQIIDALKLDVERAQLDSIGARDYFEKKSTLSGFRFPSENKNEQPPYGGGKGKSAVDAALEKYR